MPRPERPVDPAAGPVPALAAGLRELRRRAGNPGYRELAGRAGYSSAALANAAGGSQLPSLAVTLAFVRACGGDPAEWEQRWRRTAAEAARLRDGVMEGSDDTETTSPYRGLAAYDIQDAPFFFGRRRTVAHLVAACRKERLVAVFGVSGSGKSSVLRAGLVPALCGDLPHADGAQSLEGDRLFPVVLTPGSCPVDNLRYALDRVPPGRELLLVVDQFEELFTLCADPEERTQFVATLVARTRPPDETTRVVIGVRADFYPHCIEMRDLAPLLARASIPVEALTEDQLREVVTEPARSVGLSVERALVTRIVADTAGQPGAMPLVSHALLETWRQRRGSVLAASGYEAAGGVSGAIAQTAEAVYLAFTPEERRSFREIMLRLVLLGEEGVKDTRRRVDRDELDLPGGAKILHELAGARLVVLGQTTAEIAHEAVIEAWPRLRDWLVEDREVLRRTRRLTEDSKIWDAHDRDSGALYRGARLAVWDGQPVAHLNQLEREFLVTSRERHAKETSARRRRMRLVLISLVIGIAVTSLFAVLALRAAARADDERNRAVSYQLVANARQQLQTDQELALLLAHAAYDRAPIPEAAAMLRQAVIESRSRATLVTGQQQVFGVAYRPDGRQVAASGADGTVRVWTLRDKDKPDTAPRVLGGHVGYVWSPVFSADGRLLAACGVDGLVTVWDLAGDGPPLVLRGHGGVVSTVAFSSDGRFVAGAGDDGTVRVWDRTSGSQDPIRSLSLDGGPVQAVGFSPDGGRLVAAGAGPVMIWDLAGNAAPTVLTGHENTVESIAFSSDGRLLASASSDQTVRIWSLAGTEPPLVLRSDDGTVETVAFSPDGGRVASGHSGSDTIRVWNTAAGDGTDPLLLHGHDGPVWSVAFSPDGRRLLSGSGDGTLRFWDPSYPSDPQVLSGHTGPAWSVATSATGNTVASGGADRTVRVWRNARWREPLVLTGHGAEVVSVAVSSDGTRVASAARDQTARIWDADTGALIAVLQGHTKSVRSVAFSPDGRRVATGGVDGTVRIWDTNGTGTPVVLEGHEAAVRAIAFSPDGRQVASTSQDSTVRLWPVDVPGEPIVLRGSPGLVWSVGYAPDGRTLATGGDDGTIRIWNSDGQGNPRLVRGHRGPVWSVAFHPDGQQLASAGHDGTERIWHVATGQELISLRGHGAFVEQVSYSADGAHLITSHGDGTVRFTQCDACGPIAEVRRIANTHATRPLSPEERRTYLHEPGTP